MRVKVRAITIRAFFCVLSAGCATVPSSGTLLTPPRENPKEPTVLEYNIGAVGEIAIAQRYRVEFDATAKTRLTRVGNRLTHYSERPNVPYTYELLDVREPNAFSLPHGKIYLTRKVFELLDDDEQLAAMIAHELAHITHQHVVAAYNRQFSLGRLLSTALLGPWIVRVVTETGYSHQQEYQADVTALRYIIRAGYSPRAYLETLDKISASMTAYAQTLPKARTRSVFYSPHPGWANRMKFLRETLPKIEAEEKAGYKPEDFVS